MTGELDPSVLLLADGRFPAGGHVHSGGMEEAVSRGTVRNTQDLQRFLAGKLATVGRVDAALAAMARHLAPTWESLQLLDAEAVARCPSPSLRSASRSQGRGLSRAGAASWPVARSDPAQAFLGCADGQGPMFPVALGVVGWAAGLESALVAVVAAQMSISGAAWASTRLMGLDPYEVVGVISALGPAVSAVAGDAVRSLPAVGTAVADALATLPSCSATMLDIGAETHALREVRLFAS